MLKIPKLRHASLEPDLVGEWRPDERVLVLDCDKIRKTAGKAFRRYYLMVLVHELSHVFDTLILRRQIQRAEQMYASELKAYKLERLVGKLFGVHLPYSPTFLARESVKTVFAHASQGNGKEAQR